MTAKKKDVLREQVAEFYENHRELGKTFTARHFTSMGVSQRTCYQYLKECEACDGIPRQRKVGSGRKSMKPDGSC